MAGIPDVNQEYTAWAEPSCPINTPATAYLTYDMSILDQCWLWVMTVRIPPGHAGYTGIALIDSGSFVCPYSQASASWIKGDDDHYDFPLNQQTGTTVQLAIYNTSTDFAHEWEVYITYTPMSVFVGESDAIVTPSGPELAAAIEAITGG